MKLVIIIALSIVVTGCATYKGGAEPIADSAYDQRDGWIVAATTPTVLQRNLTDCGAAALAMVAGRWNQPLTLDEAAALLPPPGKEGVRLRDLRDGAKRHGLEAFAIAADLKVLRHELEQGRPVVLGLLRPMSRGKASSHFEVVIALRTKDADPRQKPVTEVVTIDPGFGTQVRTWAELEREWKPAGRPALVIIGTGASQ